MQGRVRIVIHDRGLTQIVQSREVREEMLLRARLVKDRAQSRAPSYVRLFATDFIGQRRSRASVMAVMGLPSELKHRYLGDALDAARR